MPEYIEKLEAFLARAKQCGETTYAEALALLEEILFHHKPEVALAPEVTAPPEVVAEVAPIPAEAAPAVSLDSIPTPEASAEVEKASEEGQATS